MEKTPTFAELVRQGQSSAHLQTRWYLDLERYRRVKTFTKEGFGTWTECLDALLKKIRRARSGVMAKLAHVRLLLDSRKVSFAQLEKMGDANATALCRLYRNKGLTDAWVKRAMMWNVERFKAAVAKAVKPQEQPVRILSFRITQSLYVRMQQVIGRVQTLVKLHTREGALEFIASQFDPAVTTDAEILHAAGEFVPKEKLEKEAAAEQAAKEPAKKEAQPAKHSAA